MWIVNTRGRELRREKKVQFTVNDSIAYNSIQLSLLSSVFFKIRDKLEK